MRACIHALIASVSLTALMSRPADAAETKPGEFRIESLAVSLFDTATGKLHRLEPGAAPPPGNGQLFVVVHITGPRTAFIPNGRLRLTVTTGEGGPKPLVVDTELLALEGTDKHGSSAYRIVVVPTETIFGGANIEAVVASGHQVGCRVDPMKGEFVGQCQWVHDKVLAKELKKVPFKGSGEGGGD